MIIINIKEYENLFESIYMRDIINELGNLEKIISLANSKTKDYSLNKDQFYFSKDVIYLENINNKLFGVVEENDLQNLYLSYMTLNNNFEKEPLHSLIDLGVSNKYEFDIEVNNDNLKLIPYVIHYKGKEKSKLTRMESDNKIIDFTGDDKCRLTFKIIGHGNFEIESIRITPKG